MSLGVELCRLVDHGKLHMRHGLSAWVNLTLWKGVLITKKHLLEPATVAEMSHKTLPFERAGQ